MPAQDIFQFWSVMQAGQTIHPADEVVFKRIDPKRHGFQLNCLPACFAGALKSADVVLLYLSPGYSDADAEDAASENGIEYRFNSWKGDEPFRDYGPGLPWLRERTKNFGEFESVRRRLAVLNIGAYHSKDVKSFASLVALPSSRVSLDWAQRVLFPQAEAGNRVVVCMRSAAYWGLETGRKYGVGLYAPLVNRSGFLLKNSDNGQLVELIRKRLA
ncbi:hypothetical protein HU675_0011505 [Bradyrhizobium septentrionale]|uniref:hypothetical protein n=1 Tax=Bradyrhizobium septentrionale TaxID=1404411 RepID=UPI001596495E|nr:hypothetical protein [Bradyrhizobium septentrionale]UGY27326.1 hypothetical protein HU675_0011505 [Bradyrhizobium septentrionale]